MIKKNHDKQTGEINNKQFMLVHELLFLQKSQLTTTSFYIENSFLQWYVMTHSFLIIGTIFASSYVRDPYYLRHFNVAIFFNHEIPEINVSRKFHVIRLSNSTGLKTGFTDLTHRFLVGSQSLFMSYISE